MNEEAEEKDNRLERSVSLTLGVGFAIWDAYAQAHGIPYTMPTFVYGIVMYPWGEQVYAKGKGLLTRIPTGVEAAKKLLRIAKK